MFKQAIMKINKKVWNLFMIFFQLARVKFALFIDVICNIWAQGKMGTKAFKLNIFQRIFWVLKGLI